MNIRETTRLCRAIAALAPSQKLDNETPGIWHMVLDDIRYEDAREAVINLGKTKPYIAPSDIRAEVARIRRSRLDTSTPAMPAVDPDDVHGYLGALRADLTARGDGLAPRDQDALKGRQAGTQDQPEWTSPGHPTTTPERTP